jgi:hypothetical protein
MQPAAGIRAEPAHPALPDGEWLVAERAGPVGSWEVEPGSLGPADWLTMDLFLDGVEAAVWRIDLHEGETGATFGLQYGLLNQCAARVRLPMAATDQGRWYLGREGAWLKPLCQGDRVDPTRVDRVSIVVVRMGDDPVRWCQTPLSVSHGPPPHLAEPGLPRGPLQDEMGQSTLRQWPGKTQNVGEMVSRLRRQRRAASSRRWPSGFSHWGGWRERRFEGDGFFATHHDGQRWWLVDPDGHAFWSAGMDCVRESVLAYVEGSGGAAGPQARGRAQLNSLEANLVRAFGEDSHHEVWAELALAELRRCGFNTVANWSDWAIARRAQFPYVRPLRMPFERTATVFRDFPDVFADEFPAGAARYAEQLRDTADDPAFVGYFLMNEPTWGFAAETPAKGMLLGCPECTTRRALAEHLGGRYPGSREFAASWGEGATLERVACGPWDLPLTSRAEEDLAEFSDIMVRRLFETLSDACKREDPNHLNLGVRYYTVPPDWALAGMASFDVFSMNCYNRPEPPRDELARIAEALSMPVLIGEWHFGALDVGLPATGIGRVKDQADRGRAFRVYEEAAASQRWCVGAHWFTLYDQSALGRGDGENYNIGFLDVCHRPYEELASAALSAHEQLYAVAAGERAPYDDRPEYLPPVFY